MANQKHLEKLSEGVEAWNEWRLKNPDLQPDLQGAYLREAQLQGAYIGDAQLQGADFIEAQLQEAYLIAAQLQGANLTAAQLQGANLTAAQLQGAFLSQAQLQGANLGDAQLQGAYLSGAQLQKAHLGDAQLQGAYIGDAQLQGANLNGAQLQKADFSRAQLQGANLRGAFFDNATSLNKVILADKEHGGASLADVSWGGVNLAVVDWSSLKMLGDEYEARQSTYSIEAYRTAVRANRQLAVVLRDQGLNEDADRFAYRAQVLQRKVFWKQKKFGRGFFSGFLALVAGYGYRMERILFTYAIVVSLFAAAYFILGMYYPPPIALSQAFLESITAFHGRVFSELFLLNTPQIWVTAGEAIAGLVVEGVFIAMLTQRFFGR